MPSLSADAIITDAPYGVGFDYKSFDDTEENVKDLISQLTPHILKLKRCAVFCGVPQMWMWPKPKWVLCWSYFPMTNEFSPWGFAQWQPILVYGADPFLETGKGPHPTVITHSKPPDRKGNSHPCPKPLPLMEKVILRTTLESELICDIFMGSGTTLVAAKNLGRRAIGIEIEEKYCEIAAKRLSQEVMQFGGASCADPVSAQSASG